MGTLIYIRPGDSERFERILRINQYFNLFQGLGDFSSTENHQEEMVTFEIWPAGWLAGRRQLAARPGAHLAAVPEKDSSAWECSPSPEHQSGCQGVKVGGILSGHALGT